MAVNPLVSQAQASGEREAYAFTEGNYNGAFVGIDDGDQRIILASPTIFSTDLEETDFLKLFQAGKIVMENEKNLP
ncbi:MAG: hypothetical protein H6767_00560 [Candidatus Peribacteria bacterium]|nr:MAG: hypothetical protein H6767_00560 [Candidatus Peribacteria bacterium]